MQHRRPQAPSRLRQLWEALTGTRKAERHQEGSGVEQSSYGTRRGAYAPGYVNNDTTMIINRKVLPTLGAEMRASYATRNGRNYR